jgi:hypothetical protein
MNHGFPTSGFCSLTGHQTPAQESTTLEGLPIIAVPQDALEAEFEDSVTGRSRLSHDIWVERVSRELR